MEFLKRYGFILFFFFSFHTESQISFHQLFSGNGYDYGYGLTQTEDSSYLIAGASSSFEIAPAQGLLMKTDSLGNFQWSKSYGGTGAEEFRRVKYIENYCIYLAGFSTTQSNGSFDNYLVKTDEDGNVLWEVIFGGADWDRILDMTILPDSSVFLVGSTFSFGNGAKDWGLYRYDKDGNEVWSTYFGSNLDDEVYACAYYQGFLYAGGSVFNSDSLMQKGNMVQLDLNGNVLWTSQLELDGNSVVEDFVIGNDDKVRGVGSSYSQYDVASEVQFFRMSLDGTLEANFRENRNGELHGVSIVSTLDSSLIYTVHTGRNTPSVGLFEDGFYDSFIVGFNNSFGYDNFAFNFSKTKNDFIYDMIMSADGGAVMVGEQNFFDDSGAQLCLIKLGPNRETTLPDDSFLDNIVSVDKDELAQFSVYPNPTNGKISLSTALEYLKIDVYNAQGKLLQTLINEKQIDLTSYPEGLYTLNLKSKKTFQVLKVVKY